MYIKTIVDALLKEKKRNLSWLAKQMHRTFDGLKLSLVKGTIKYTDLINMASILEVNSKVFFEDSKDLYEAKKSKNLLAEKAGEYSVVKRDLENCTVLVSTLKSQLKDKDKIISLLNKG